MTREEQKRIVEEQFAIDYNCSVEDFENTETLVTCKKKLPGARKCDNEDSMLSILSYRGKLVITAAEELLPWCEDVLKANLCAEWAFEAGSLISIEKKLNEYGYGIDQAHIFFLPKEKMAVGGQKLRWLTKEEIPALEEDERIDEAFLFDDDIPDMLGVAAVSEQGEMLAVAGASANSDRMWEMGVNSFAEGNGYGQAVLKALTGAVFEKGKVPYCGTALSHCASMNIMLKAGFVPSFCELRSVKLD